MARHDDQDGNRAEPAQVSAEPAQVSGAASHAVAGGYKIAIRRTGQSVEITLTSNSDYASMELYDSLIQSVKGGRLHLEINLPRS